MFKLGQYAAFAGLNKTGVLFLIPVAICLLGNGSLSHCQAEIVSFDTNTFSHDGGLTSQTGFQDGQFTGTTSVLGGESLTISTTSIGTPSAFEPDHFTRIDAAFFEGFAIRLDSGSTRLNDRTTPGAPLTNYGRIDFEFSTAVQLDSFTLNDVDRGDINFYDIVAVEGFLTSDAGVLGTGFSPDYAFESITNLEEVVDFGLNAVRPRIETTGTLQLPESDVTFSFTEPINSFSIYYYNANFADSDNGGQTIGISGNQFEVSEFVAAVPEPGSVIVFCGSLFLLNLRRRRVSHFED